jgi:hypothetical protein
MTINSKYIFIRRGMAEWFYGWSATSGTIFLFFFNVRNEQLGRSMFQE